MNKSCDFFEKYDFYQEKQQEGFCNRCSTPYPLDEFAETIIDYPCTNYFNNQFCGGIIVLREKKEETEKGEGEQEAGEAKKCYKGPIDCEKHRHGDILEKNTMKTIGLDIFCSKCNIRFGCDYLLPANFLDIPCSNVDHKLPLEKRVPCGGKWVAIKRVIFL